MLRFPAWVLHIFAVLAAVLTGGCERAPAGVRQYEEIVIAPPRPPSSAAAGAPAPPAMGRAPEAQRVLWTLPEGWAEQPSRPPRIATFGISRAEGQAECTITSFPGGVGGTEANLRRWAGQIGVPLDEAGLAAVIDGGIAFATTHGLQGTLYDFGPLVQDDGQASMLAAMLRRAEDTVFVKATGPRALLEKERDRLLELCRSLTGS